MNKKLFIEGKMPLQENVLDKKKKCTETNQAFIFMCKFLQILCEY